MSPATLLNLITLVALLGTSAAQVTSSAEMKGSEKHRAFYTRTASEIAETNPAVDRSTLDKDLPVVEDAEEKVRRGYPHSFSDSDITHITAYAWMDFRKRQPSGQLDSDRFVKFTLESYGGLKITSTPTGAAIEVDAKPWSDPTDAQGSCRTGKRQIKLSKAGYKDEIGFATVNEGQWTLFHRDLKKK